MGSKRVMESHRFFAVGSPTSVVQRAQDAVDLGECSEATVIIYIEDYCASGTLYFQSAPERAEQLFSRVSGASLAITSTGAKYLQLSGFSRYVRWEIANPYQYQTQFSIDVFGRTPQPQAGS